MRHFGICAAAAAVIGLAGCAETLGAGEMAGGYGEATRANFAVQAGGPAGRMLVDLSQRFEQETDEVVTFAFDSAALDATARRALQGQARWLRAHPSVRMVIVGHTDLVGPESYNYGLGLRRAKAALEYLVGHGVPRALLEAIESRGEEEPVVPTTRRERRNRRAVTMVAGFAPGYAGPGLDGVYAQRVYNQYQAGQFRVREARSAASQ